MSNEIDRTFSEKITSFITLIGEDTEISYSDFIAAALRKRISITESQLLMAFEHVDQERNGEY